ncbi:MAG TPA: DUF2877 domain-containing protein [Thermodesulfobacteriota bacterium]|nr:DUF2877 domain-containing protein [Thermodesulfobacteriota bacterium]
MQATAKFLDQCQKERPLLCLATLIGSSAKALLTRPGFSGKVLAVLSTTIYLVSGDGEILWLSQNGLAMHRRCVLASFQPRSICVGQNFLVEGPFLQFFGGVTIDLDPATEWKPSPVGPKDAEPLVVVNACTHRLVEAITRIGDAKGFGQMIPLISSLVDRNKQPTSIADPLLAKACDSILNLATACCNFDMTAVTQRGRELIGLGPGLTPSGDDFLGGLLFAAHSLKTAYPQDFNWGEEPVEALIDWAFTETHPISHAILRDHASGHGPEPLHELASSLLKGRDLGRTLEGAGRLIGIGDTSGWDILAGMLTGMLFVEEKLNTRPTPFLLFERGRSRITNGGDH